MGSAGDSLAVLDEALRVRGVDRLRVADASVFPAIPTANINMTCMMVGEKAAALLLESA
jgi:choline dehydrogenase-like flavoprotein